MAAYALNRIERAHDRASANPEIPVKPLVFTGPRVEVLLHAIDHAMNQTPETIGEVLEQQSIADVAPLIHAQLPHEELDPDQL